MFHLFLFLFHPRLRLHHLHVSLWEVHLPYVLEDRPRLSCACHGVYHRRILAVFWNRDLHDLLHRARGGLYPYTSVVVVQTQDVIPKLQAEAEKAVRQMGFTPSPNAGPGAPQLTLTLAELNYQSPKELYVTASDVAAAFQVDVRNSQRGYRGRYGASLNQRFGMAPNAEANTKLVSDVLSDALTRVFKDPTVVQVLSGR